MLQHAEAVEAHHSMPRSQVPRYERGPLCGRPTHWAQCGGTQEQLQCARATCNVPSGRR